MAFQISMGRCSMNFVSRARSYRDFLSLALVAGLIWLKLAEGQMKHNSTCPYMSNARDKMWLARFLSMRLLRRHQSILVLLEASLLTASYLRFQRKFAFIRLLIECLDSFHWEQNRHIHMRYSFSTLSEAKCQINQTYPKSRSSTKRNWRKRRPKRRTLYRRKKVSSKQLPL